MAHIDFETFSRADLIRVGSHRYAADPSTEPLCLGVSLDPVEDPARAVDLSGDRRPAALHPLFDHVAAGGTLTAHNAEFERSIWNMMAARFGWPRARRSQFHCTAARSVAAGFPRSLEGAAARVGLTATKDPKGKALLKLFAMPQKGGGRVYPHQQPTEYNELMKYCQQDVVVETGLDAAVPQLYPFERNAFLMDSLLNDRGFPIDVPLVRRAIQTVSELTIDVNNRVAELTGGLRGTQRDKLLAWLNDEGADMDTLQAMEVKDMIADGDVPANVREVLELRMEASRAGIGKLKTMMECVCPDGRVRGGHLFYGAHTGRWSGVKVQPHNFARGNPKAQDMVLDLLQAGGADYLRMFYGNPLVVLSESMRGFIATPEDQRWVFADYAAIEARVLAWLANELAMLARYRQGVDLYIWMASMIYDTPESEITKEQRRVGKNTVLGCGYNMGGPGFVRYLAAAGIEVSLEFATRAVMLYRNMVQAIVQYWRDVERCAIGALRNRGVTYPLRQVKFVADGTALRIFLPSGRPIVYQDAFLEETITKYGPKDVVGFYTMFKGRWVPEYTYGGKLVENICQGVSRDIMVEGMINGEKAGYPICMTVHDEIGAPMPHGKGSFEEFERIITQLPEWAHGLPLGAEGFEGRRYRKN